LTTWWPTTRIVSQAWRASSSWRQGAARPWTWANDSPPGEPNSAGLAGKRRKPAAARRREGCPAGPSPRPTAQPGRGAGARGVRGGHDGGGLDGREERAAVAVVEASVGEEVARRLGLADAESGQGGVVAPALDARRPGQVGFGGAVADQVQDGPRLHGAIN